MNPVLPLTCEVIYGNMMTIERLPKEELERPGGDLKPKEA